MTTLRIILWLILIYYIALNGIYLLLVLLGLLQRRHYHRGITFLEFVKIGNSTTTMPVSVIVPCFNEAPIVLSTINNILRLNYPEFEIIIVDDGSTDGMLNVLSDHLALHQVERFGRRRIPTKEILGIYESRHYPNIVVLSKIHGQRADAINAAATLSKYPLLCIIDADCILEEDLLLQMARPFLSNNRVAAVAGIVRPSNGLKVADGEILEKSLPKTLLGLNQEIEYARSFQWARIGLNRLRSMLCISGALLLIKKSLFEQLGGPWPGAITDDIEFTIRLNKHIHDRRNKDQQCLAFVPDAVCYTQVPETYKNYASQRNRWQRGTLQAMLRNCGMIFNPRYGMTGLFGMPFFMIFEALSAVVEISAWILMIITLILGVATLWEIAAMIYLAYIASFFFSLTAVLMTESSRLRTANWHDFWKLLLAIFLDNLGFHQFHLLARVTGTFQYLVLGRRDLGIPMQRRASGIAL
jgi:cellulose synthase/poly-beta-1,6-N-acetylglucosamine synthase-like glycosyltransferase